MKHSLLGLFLFFFAFFFALFFNGCSESENVNAPDVSLENISSASVENSLVLSSGVEKDSLSVSTSTTKQTCEENVTVTYGPPVASKAGLCFEYKVKVESKVNCETEFTAAQPEPEDYEICTPDGSCNGGAYHSASGPNDEFDSCVSSCDGGKYTQKCIDKCS